MRAVASLAYSRGGGVLYAATEGGGLFKAYPDSDKDGVPDIQEDRNDDRLRQPPHVKDTDGEASSQASMVTKRNLAYGQHQAQRLDLYVPGDAKDAPVMVYVHGGAWTRGDKTKVGRKAELFTSKGWVFVSVNYRLLPEGQHPRNVEDVAVSLAWVHDHISKRGGDADSLFLMGHSAGCHLVSLVATDRRYLEHLGKSLAMLKGVIALDTQAYDIPKLMVRQSRASNQRVFGETVKGQKDASPIHHVAQGRDIPPFLIFYSRGHTKRITPTRREQPEAFAAALKAAGVAAEVVDAGDRTHNEINLRFGDPEDNKVTGKAMTFLNDILGKKATTPPQAESHGTTTGNGP